MKRLLTIVSAAAMLLAASFSMDAQTTKKSKDYAPFESVEVSKYFTVTFENSNSYHVDWEVEDVLAPYVDIYVRQNVLIVNLDKEGAKEMKKNFRGATNSPVMKVKIQVPALKGLVMKENARINPDSEPIYAPSFSLTVKDKAKIDNLIVNVDETADLNLSKDADVTMKMQAKKINIHADHSAVMALTHASGSMNVELMGSSSVGLGGDVDTLNVVTMNASKLNVQGNGKVLNCSSKGVSEVQAERYEVENASVVLNSAIARVNATAQIMLDLSNSSELIFCGQPAMIVKAVKKSSITRIENMETK